MTEYPVQCFEHNGEPYGRYKNPYGSEINHPVHGTIESRDIGWDEFNQFAEANAFPMPGGTIGKTYKRDEVEVEYQYFAEWNNGIEEWLECDRAWFDAISRKSVCPTRQIFRLIPPPVEKEPETVHVVCEECEGSGIVKGPYGKQLCNSCYGQEPETVDNDLYFEVAEIAQDNIVIKDPDRFNKPFFQTTSNEKNSKLKKKYHAQVQFDALQFIRDLKNKGYKITKQ